MKRIKVHKAYFITWLFILYVIYSNFEVLSTFFMATVIFSSAIIGFLAVGTLYQFVSGYDMMMTGGTFGALAYKKTGYEFYIRKISAILPANISHMLETRKNQQKLLFTQEESRDIIDWLENKVVKQKSYINFFINTSMLIGLLGTFVGLVESIDKMGQIIISMNTGDVDIKDVMQQFAAPLSGMAIGFGASLFGVVSAVILGLNGYILFRYQDTLISGIEEWLKDRIIDIAPDQTGQSGSGFVGDLGGRKSFMDVFVEQMSELTTQIEGFTRTQESFHGINASLAGIHSAIQEQNNYFQAILETQERGIAQNQELSHAYKDAQASQGEKLERQEKVLTTLLSHSENALSDNERMHEQVLERSDKIVNNAEQLIQQMVQMDSNLQQGVALLHEDGVKNSDEFKVAIQNQVKVIEAIRHIGSTLDHKNDVLIANQKEMMQLERGDNEKLLNAIHELEFVLHKNREALGNMVSLDEKALEEAQQFHNEVIGLHQQLLSASQALNSEQKKAAVNNGVYTEEISRKLVEIERTLNSTMRENIKAFGSFESALSGIKHTDGTKKKGFFSSLFEK